MDFLEVKAMPIHDKYADAVSTVDIGREKMFKNIVTSGEFWVDLKKAVEIMQPMSDAIHCL
jgi:hypothetical protein